MGLGKDGSKVTTVVATPGQGSDRVQEVSYTDTRVIGNGSFGVVFQAKLCDTGELVAIKKVLQDRRFKVSRNNVQKNTTIHFNLIFILSVLFDDFFFFVICNTRFWRSIEIFKAKKRNKKMGKIQMKSVGFDYEAFEQRFRATLSRRG